MTFSCRVWALVTYHEHSVGWHTCTEPVCCELCSLTILPGVWEASFRVAAARNWSASLTRWAKASDAALSTALVWGPTTPFAGRMRYFHWKLMTACLVKRPNVPITGRPA